MNDDIKIINQAGLTSCKEILQKLIQHKDAEPFIRPANSLTESYNIDLSTILCNLENNKYESPLEVAQDIRLVFSNCFVINSVSSNIFKMGKRLLSAFERMWIEVPLGMTKY